MSTWDNQELIFSEVFRKLPKLSGWHLDLLKNEIQTMLLELDLENGDSSVEEITRNVSR